MVPYCNLNHKVSDDSMSVFIKPWSDYNSHQSSCLSYPAETAPDTQTWKKGINCTLNTSLTAVINSGPTPSPGNMVTLKVASARAGGASGPQSAAETLSGREACGHRGLFRPWRRGGKTSQNYNNLCSGSTVFKYHCNSQWRWNRFTKIITEHETAPDDVSSEYECL